MMAMRIVMVVLKRTTSYVDHSNNYGDQVIEF